MKKIFFIICCFSLLTIYGCGGDNSTPEDFSKNYVEKKFSGIKYNLEDLDYTVTEDGENKATVKVKGEIKYEETISLVKKGNKWMLAPKAAKKAKKDAPKKLKAVEKADH